MADLDRVIACGRDALARAEGRPVHPGLLTNLGSALVGRYELFGDPADLDEGIIAFERATAVALSVNKPRVRVAARSNLAAALRRQAGRTGRVTTLDQAIATGRRVLGDRASRRSDRSAAQVNLSGCLRMRCELTGEADVLDEAVDMAREAVSATRPRHAQRALRLNNLTLALCLRSQRAGRPQDLDEAVNVARAAVRACPADEPALALYLSNLGAMLRMRSGPGGRAEDLEEAVAVSRVAAAIEPAPPRVRAGAARGWGHAAALAGRWAEAADGYAAAVGLLGRVAPRGLARGGQEHQLDDLSGVGADAAACCVRAGEPERAVELFEEGRGVLLGQAMDAMTDLTALAEQDDAAAREFTALLGQLDWAGRPPGDAASAEAGPSAAGTVLRSERRREIAAQLEELVTRVRELPGFGRFLRPLEFTELSAAAQAGPVVIVNVSQFGSCALILAADGVQEPLPLPGLTPETVLDQVNAFLDALDQASPPARERGVEATLAWLWDELAGPVVARLAGPAPHREGEPWPRLWWCASGLLALLPLHAARKPGQPDGPDGPAVSDHVASSYTPTLRALVRARQRPAGAAGRVIAVAMPQTPGERELPETLGEAVWLHDRFPGQVTVLAGPEATFAAVAATLPGARWAHFACHAFSDPAYPSASALLLYDHESRPLAFPDIARLDLAGASLAFLSACATARTGGRLADEAIHLASAFQLAGFRQVIGTLWPVGDHQARELAQDIYAAIGDGGDAAVAVHEAARRRSRQRPAQPSEWASHVHFGP